MGRKQFVETAIIAVPPDCLHWKYYTKINSTGKKVVLSRSSDICMDVIVKKDFGIGWYQKSSPLINFPLADIPSLVYFSHIQNDNMAESTGNLTPWRSPSLASKHSAALNSNILTPVRQSLRKLAGKSTVLDDLKEFIEQTESYSSLIVQSVTAEVEVNSLRNFLVVSQKWRVMIIRLVHMMLWSW